ALDAPRLPRPPAGTCLRVRRRVAGCCLRHRACGLSARSSATDHSGGIRQARLDQPQLDQPLVDASKLGHANLSELRLDQPNLTRFIDARGWRSPQLGAHDATGGLAEAPSHWGPTAELIPPGW
ncbi:MAG: hypothetical protein ACK550_17720, partial [Synechococcaceae cyanobacterium]